MKGRWARLLRAAPLFAAHRLARRRARRTPKGGREPRAGRVQAWAVRSIWRERARLPLKARVATWTRVALVRVSAHHEPSLCPPLLFPPPLCACFHCLRLPQEIHRAYRRLALRFHPDKAGDAPEAAERFKAAAAAHHVLSDPERRETYDRARERLARRRRTPPCARAAGPCCGRSALRDRRSSTRPRGTTS